MGPQEGWRHLGVPGQSEGLLGGDSESGVMKRDRGEKERKSEGEGVMHDGKR